MYYVQDKDYEIYLSDEIRYYGIENETVFST